MRTKLRENGFIGGFCKVRSWRGLALDVAVVERGRWCATEVPKLATNECFMANRSARVLWSLSKSLAWSARCQMFIWCIERKVGGTLWHIAGCCFMPTCITTNTSMCIRCVCMYPCIHLKAPREPSEHLLGQQPTNHRTKPRRPSIPIPDPNIQSPSTPLQCRNPNDQRA